MLLYEFFSSQILFSLLSAVTKLVIFRYKFTPYLISISLGCYTFQSLIRIQVSTIYADIHMAHFLNVIMSL